MGSCEAVERTVYTNAMIETWSAILGLLLFGCFIWWITTSTGFWGHVARSSREPPPPKVKAIWWITYAVTALWVLANSSCEGPDPLGEYQEEPPRQHAREFKRGRGGIPERDWRRPTDPDGTHQSGWKV
jgi:hypothetical protein